MFQAMLRERDAICEAKFGVLYRLMKMAVQLGGEIESRQELYAEFLIVAWTVPATRQAASWTVP